MTYLTYIYTGLQLTNNIVNMILTYLTYIYPGLHLTNNIVNMILTGDLAYKGTPILPEHNDLDAINAMESPRILAFHTHFKFLPKQIQEGKARVIYLLRNPKDLATSLFLYNEKLKGEIPMYVGNWRGFVRFFLQDECKFYYY